MPADPSKKRIEVHLTQNEYQTFQAEATFREWSNKKLAEHIIKKWLIDTEKAKSKKEALKK